MREIKFRGKIPEGKWIYGGISINDYRVWIDQEYYGDTFVDKETVGQYAGLKDKNGVEIYEGDIVEFYEVGKMWKAKIGYDSGAFTVDFGGGFYYLCSYSMESNLFEVIGNIYDNPELLKESD